MKKRKKKNILKILLLFVITTILFLPMAALASEDGKYSNTDLIKDIISSLNALNQTEDADFYQELYNGVLNADVSDYLYIIQTQNEIITDIMETAAESISLSQDDLSYTNFLKEWQEEFKQDAAAYGVNMGEYIPRQEYYVAGDAALGVESVIEAHYETSDDNDTEDLLEDAEKVQMLEWGQTGGSYTTSTPVIAAFLNEYDSNSAFSSITNIIKGIAMAMTIAFGTMALLTMVSDKQLSTEALQREIIKILAGVWFIYNYKFFALLALRAGSYITEIFYSALNPDTGVTAAATYIKISLFSSLATVMGNHASGISNFVAVAATNTGAVESATPAEIIMEALSSLLSGVTDPIGTGIIQLATSLTIYAIIIEIGIRYMFTPLAIADLYTEKWRSSGFRWIKGLFACTMQGAIIILVIFGCDKLKDLVGGYNVISNMAINATMIGMFAKSRSIANEIIGMR